MYIDFHYYMIKALATKAGFAPDEAEDIAYASEYIDDALEFLPMKIDAVPGYADALRRADGQFAVVCTAHDETTMIGGALTAGQERTYMPFHFVPRDTIDVPKERYDFRTAPNCPVARGLVDVAVEELKAARGDERTRKLIKLGIALHTYADTWAHRDFSSRFAGSDNAVAQLEVLNGGNWEIAPLDTAPALVPETGHAKAHAYPDSSHTRWRYYNGETREFFDRNNPALYLEAAEAIYRVLCDAAGQPPHWDEIRGRVESCINFKPGANIWVKEGIEDKIRHYLETFPEVFRTENGGAEYHRYDEWAWRRDALQPYRLRPDGMRQDLAFGNGTEFDMRRLVDEAMAHFKSCFRDKSGWEIASLGASALGGNASAIVAETVKPIVDWYQTMRSTRYACKPPSLAAAKWFYFNLEAEAQRQYVLARAHPIGQAYAAPADEIYEQTFTQESLAAQIRSVLSHAAARYTMFKPSDTLKGKSYWMSVTIENRTPYPVVWRGHHDGDFAFSGGHGRYWDRPDRGGTLQPGQTRTFSACERDNAATGSTGVALFEIAMPHGAPIPFSVAFSQPLLDDKMHLAKLGAARAGEAVGNAARSAGNLALEGLDFFAKTIDSSVDMRIEEVVIPVAKRPKCRASFVADRARAYDALDGGTQEHNGDHGWFAAGHFTLTTDPGQEARVVIAQ